MRRPIEPQHEAFWLERAQNSTRIVDTASYEEAPENRGIFLAHAFSGILGEDGRINRDAQERVAALLGSLRAEGYGVHCSLDREDWGAKLMGPKAALVLDQDQVGKADLLISFPQGSPGAFMELGMRAALAKPALIVKTEPPANGDPAINIEELAVIDAAQKALDDAGAACTIIEGSAVDLPTFERTVVSPVIDWTGENI